MASSAWRTGTRVALFGMIVNSIFAVAKILGGLFGHAYRPDRRWHASPRSTSGDRLFIWSGLKVARARRMLPSLWSRESGADCGGDCCSWSLAAAVGLAIQSVREIFLPHHAPAPYTLGILIVVIVTKKFLFRYVNRIGHDVESTAVQTDAWHHRSDALTSAAAFIGISVALIGGKRWQSADDWAALFACAVIGANGIRPFAPRVLRDHGHRSGAGR